MKLTRQEKFRLGFLFVIVCLSFSLIAVRLGHLQVVNASEYQKQVEKQTSLRNKIPATRGMIYDRNGKVVANNVIMPSIFAQPNDTKELKEAARYLEKLLGLPKGTAIKEYGLKVGKFRWVERWISDKLAARVLEDSQPGIHLRNEVKRKYPYGMIGKQILGFTGNDGRGRSCFEYAYDSVLAGKEGYSNLWRDGHRNTFQVQEKALVKPVSGKSMVLTVDWTLQEIVEEELKIGVEKYNAEQGMAVFINNNNGQILAAAYYDPNEKLPEKPMKLRPFTNLLEPGSIFKAYTAAAILENGSVNFNDTVYCEMGKWKVGKKIIKDDKDLAWENFRSIVELSSNIGIGKMAIDLGGDKLYDHLKKFHFGDKLDLPWPGEPSGIFSEHKNWPDLYVAQYAMGHGVAVSPLQLAAAMGAIANGGTLYKPNIILGDVNTEGKLEHIRKPVELGEVIGGKNADTLRSFLKGVVEVGTAADRVKSPLVSIAGKTGTAQMVKPGGGYYLYKFNSGFAGFFPADNPIITGVVIYQNPQPIRYGGWTAGPTFRRVAERFTLLNPDLFTDPEKMIAENSDKMEETGLIPNLIGHTLEEAQEIAQKKNFKLRCNDKEGTVVWQFPSGDYLSFEDDEIIVAVKNSDSEDIKMADLRGLSVRESSAFLTLAGISYKVKGNGRVVSQSIKPGTKLTANTECRLECKPI